MPDTPTPPPAGRPDDEPDLEAMLRSLLGDTDNPELAQALGAMGLDQSDPATMGMISAQLKAMFSGGGGAFNSIFQSPGGPPLILVCIAAGLLLGAFTGVLVMRRVRPGHALLVHRGADGALRLGPERGAGVGEKPAIPSAVT